MYIILTQPTLTESVSDLRREELKQNIASAIVTAKCMIGETTVEQQDAATAFNVNAWRHYLLPLMTYADMCIESLNFRYSGTLPNGGDKIQADIASIINTVADDPEELMTLPRWAGNGAVQRAMQGYCIWRDRAYAEHWPELVARDFPFPDGFDLRLA